jgi:hypothetical protein
LALQKQGGGSMSAANNALDALAIRLDHIGEQPAGVQRFMKAVRRAGDDDPLHGPQWLIPGILLEGQTALCPGAPGTGKSFAILDWAARITQGLNFVGKPVLQGGSIYVTGEGQAGLAKRIAALAMEYELSEASPFLYVRTMPRLLDQQEVKDFIAALKLETLGWGVPVRAITFDTFNRAIVGGSENDGKDVARLLDADNRIKDAFDCATIYAHHPGKAEGNELRGHSSLLGDTDVTCVFSGKTGTRTVEIKKQKDDEDGGLFGYTLRQVQLGSHAYNGDPVTSCLVDWVDGHTAREVKAASTTWPRGLTLIYDTINAAILEAGFDYQVSGYGPTVKAVHLDQVRALHQRRYVGTGDGDRTAAERQAFKRNLKAAQDRRLIGGEIVGGKDTVWVVR